MAAENTNIFISDLPADIDDEKLKTIFAAYGTVTWSKVMQSKGKPTSTAIVEFADVGEAKWCVENLDGNIAEGLSEPIQVKYKIDNRGKGKGKDGGKGKTSGGFGKSPTGGKDSGKAKGGGKSKGFTPYEGGKGAVAAPAGENTNIFISDLPAEMDDEWLKSVFGAYGTVTWSKVMQSKGKPTTNAIVEFADIAEAKWCVENLDGNIAEGLTSPIQVKFKSDRGKGTGKDGKGKNAGGTGKVSAPAGGKVGGSKGWTPLPKGGKGFSPYEGGKNGAAATENTNIFISDLPAEMDDEWLKTVFGAYGTVTWSKVMQNKGKGTTSAIVEFADIAEAKWCVENLDGNIAEGLASPIQVKFKSDRAKGAGKDGKGKNAGGFGKISAPAGGKGSGVIKGSSPKGGKGGKNGAAAAPAAESTNIFISDLPAEMDEEWLKTIFGAYGTITWCKVMSGKGKPTSAAIVEFADIGEAKWCVENLDGKSEVLSLTSPVQVKFKSENAKGKGKA